MAIVLRVGDCMRFDDEDGSLRAGRSGMGVARARGEDEEAKENRR